MFSQEIERSKISSKRGLFNINSRKEFDSVFLKKIQDFPGIIPAKDLFAILLKG
jgi:hypothetical protein